MPVTTNRTNALLWSAQVLLAALFLFAGGVKLAVPIEQMLAQMKVPLPGAFLQFIGVCEVLGAIGLILPGLLGIKPGLTPLAALGLVIIMLGATTVTIIGGDILPALVPFAVGLLLACVAYGRMRFVPYRGSARVVLQAAN